MLRLLILLSSLLLIACTTTPTVQINIKDSYITEPKKILVSLMGVNGRPYKQKKLTPGSHIFHIERLEAINNEHATQSFHTIRVKIQDATNYEIKSKTEQGVIYVWLENSANNEIASSMSSLPDYNIPEIALPKDIETIAISGRRINSIDLNGTNNCHFKRMASSQNEGFSGSITDKKLPDRFNRPRC